MSSFPDLLSTVSRLTPEECGTLFRQHCEKLSSIRRNLKIELITSLTPEKRDILLQECEVYNTLTKNEEIWSKLIQHRFGIYDAASMFGYDGSDYHSFDVYTSILQANTLHEEENNDRYSILIESRNLVGLKYLAEVVEDLDDEKFPLVIDEAVQKGFTQAISTLLEDKSKKNVNISLSLITALENKKYNIARILIEYGVDIDVYNEEGMSPILIASSDTSSEVVSIIDRLIDLNADVDDYDTQNRTPMMMAASSGNALVVKLLLEEGADPEMTDNSGRTAMDYAEEYNHETIIKMLE